jgi:nucleoside-diphosphate-sugar epimerase
VLLPRGGYAFSKASVEELCVARLGSGATVTVVRPFTVAGEGQRPDMALARWIDAARAGRPLHVLGSPHRTRDVTDVRDAARALVVLAESRFKGPVNIGTGQAHSLADLVDAVAAAVDVPVRTVVEPAHQDEVADTLADTRRLRALVGFVPETDVPSLVARQARAAVPEAVALVASSSVEREAVS